MTYAKPLLVFMLFALLLCPDALAKPPVRTLTDVSVVGDERTAEVRLMLGENLGQPLGKVYYSGESIRVVVENTRFVEAKAKRITSDDSLIKYVMVQPQGNHVSLLIQLTARVASIMERIVFTPAQDHTVITFRKDGFYALPAVPAVADTLAPGAAANVADSQLPAPLPVVEPPPLVAPAELAEVHPAPVADPALPGELVARREQSLTQILDPPPALPDAPVEPVSVETHVIAEIPEGEKIAARIEGVGVAAPDLTNLYIMTAVVLLVAALWFGFTRARRGGFSLRDEPLKVVKAHNLGGKQRLMVVEAEGRRLLLSATDKEVRLLTELEAGHSPDEALSQAAKSDTVRYLFNDKAASGVPAQTGQAPPKTRTERPAYFGNSGPKKSFGAAGAAAVEDEGLREKLRGLRRKG